MGPRLDIPMISTAARITTSAIPAKSHFFIVFSFLGDREILKFFDKL
jgi:hypothetical protein